MIENETLTPAVTDADFSSVVESESSGLVLVDFWAAWCGPCRMIAPALEQLAREYEGRARIVKLDVDANPATMMRFNVRSIPALLLFKDGEHVDMIVGAVPKAMIERKLQQHL
jgi:thioredoxin 1